MFDPLVLAAETEKLVARGDERKYYRFRAARFYGGIATADCVGCCLRCAFCWAWRKVVKPRGPDRLYTPHEVAHRIVSITEKHHFYQARLSGNEPTLARAHLISLLQLLPREISFILETNGILIGNDAGYACELAAFPNLHVRVSVKGCTEDEFSRLTGAEPGAFALQLKALEHLAEAGVSCHPAVVVSFSDRRSIHSLRERLRRIGPGLVDFEAEDIFTNPDIERRLGEQGLLPTEGQELERNK
jgi:uncharacterized Fe-S cluster-containing radical SAM superfamily protein